ncbi:MAG TPA: type VI secretion system contractile sheath large subunit, partial [Marinagarivorans sp.]|nr:type VI secretion system contractile sheath large subunit [Marinagarivorans sp.]
MADTELESQGAGSAEAQELSYLSMALDATRQTSRDDAEDLLKNLTREVMAGTVKWNKNLTVTINSAIAAIDKALSKQLTAIMQHPKFTKLEGSWRGLNYLVSNSETSSQLKIRVLNASKKEISKDLERAVEFDQSNLFKKIYESEFGTAGGEPYSCLIGDYEFSAHPDDVSTLTNISGVAAAGFCRSALLAGGGFG